MAGSRQREQPSSPRWRSWPGDPTGETVLVPGTAPTTWSVVELGRLGFRRARTGALSDEEARPLREKGWTDEGRLHLLRHDLESFDRPPAVTGVRVRRGRPWDLTEVVPIDDAGFPPIWRLGRVGLREALAATSRSTLRLASAREGLAGFAISGMSGRRGYLQRLAVAPSHRRRGVGRALTLDSLRWLSRRRASEAVVNTYEGNEAALELYRSVGFVEVSPGLVVLSIDL